MYQLVVRCVRKLCDLLEVHKGVPYGPYICQKIGMSVGSQVCQ